MVPQIYKRAPPPFAPMPKHAVKGKYEREREKKKTHSTPNTVPAYHVVLFKVETQMEPLEKKRFSPPRDDRTSLLLPKTKAFIQIPR